MALLKTRCPECNAGLKSPTGFTVGQTVCCPKCETYFAVEEPSEEEDAEPKKASAGAAKGKAKAAPTAKQPVKASAADEDEQDEEDDAPKTKKKKKKKANYDEDEEGTRSYKNSPLRFVVLGVLVVIMLVLGYFLYEKRKADREMAAGDSTPAPAETPPPPPPPAPKFNPKKQPNVVGGGAAGGGPPVPLVGLLGGGPALTPAATAIQIQKFKTALVGTWVANLGGGAAEELTYNANGTFTTKLTGPTTGTLSGKYTVRELVGTKGVKIQLDTGGGARTVTAIFEDDELQHPTLQAGVTGTFRKK